MDGPDYPKQAGSAGTKSIAWPCSFLTLIFENVIIARSVSNIKSYSKRVAYGAGDVPPSPLTTRPYESNSFHSRVYNMTKNLEINTERLLLRSVRLADAQAIFKYRSDSITNQYQGWIPRTIDDVYDFIKNRVTSSIDLIDTWHQFVIIKKENSELIGDIGLHFLDSDKKQVEIGYTLDKNQHGQGYATEALKETINYLFNELNKRRIVSSMDPRNIKSIGLVERLGFRKEAHFKESILINGEWVDDLLYAILKDEWLEKKQQYSIR